MCHAAGKAINSLRLAKKAQQTVFLTIKRFYYMGFSADMKHIDHTFRLMLFIPEMPWSKHVVHHGQGNVDCFVKVLIIAVDVVRQFFL